ncbi:MAG: hypothetical protein LBM75_06045 [Myxococcales bacterium]|nr:hypothetical protein [Myxococcales bacterium]
MGAPDADTDDAPPPMRRRPPPPRGARAAVGADFDERAYSTWSPEPEATPFSALDPVNMTPEDRLEKARCALIGTDIDDYQERFASDSVFNVYGFFLGYLWYSYRGMLGLALLSAFINPFACGIPQFIFIFAGDAFYRKHINKKAQELAKFEPDSDEWRQYAERYGGTSISRAFAFIVIYFGVWFLIGLLFMMLIHLFGGRS